MVNNLYYILDFFHEIRNILLRNMSTGKLVKFMKPVYSNFSAIFLINQNECSGVRNVKRPIYNPHCKQVNALLIVKIVAGIENLKNKL